jgi:subtilisin-like proprotein convertase family protein
MVTGVVALVDSLHPGWTYRQVIDQVLRTVTPIDALKGRSVTGGLVNAAGAVGAAVTPTPPPPPTGTGVRVWTSATAVAIPAVGQAVSTLVIRDAVKIGKLEVKISLTYPADGNLFVYLEGPNGTKVLLSNRLGGAGANFTGTLFSAAAKVPITAGKAPFNGTFRPEGLLSNFTNLTTKGTWKLVVVDRVSGRVGRITGWSLLVTPAGSATTAAVAAQDVETVTVASVSPPQAEDEPAGPAKVAAPEVEPAAFVLPPDGPAASATHRADALEWWRQLSLFQPSRDEEQHGPGAVSASAPRSDLVDQVLAASSGLGEVSAAAPGPVGVAAPSGEDGGLFEALGEPVV